jgi:hypothetical protein
MNERTPLHVLEAGFDDTAELQRALVRNGCAFPVVKEATPNRTTLAEVQSWKADILKAVSAVERIPGPPHRTKSSPDSPKAIAILRRIGSAAAASALGMNYHTVRKALSRGTMGEDLASKILTLKDLPTPPARAVVMKGISYDADPRIDQVCARIQSEGINAVSKRCRMTTQALNRILRLRRVIGRTADKILAR